MSIMSNCQLANQMVSLQNSNCKLELGVCVCGEGGGGDNGGICGPGVRASISKSTPFIYLAFEKYAPNYIRDRPSCCLFKCCPLILYTHLLLIVRQILQSIHWIPREQAATKNRWAKNTPHIPGYQKNGAFHIWIKIGSVIYLLLKKGSSEKGDHSARTSVLCYI